jgi:peptide/nickel transport system permease protein
MLGGIGRRLILAVLTVFLVVSLTFLLLQIAPGNPYAAYIEGCGLDPNCLTVVQSRWQADEPVYRQYFAYMDRLVHGDFGNSISNGRPVLALFAAALPNTIILGLGAMAVTFGLGVVLGTLQAVRAGTIIDHATSLITLTAFSIPVYWLGLMLAAVLAERLGWFPSLGAYDPSMYNQMTFAQQVANRLHHLVLPAISLGIVGAAWIARHHRAAMLDVLTSDFVRTAHAKGISRSAVLRRHVMRNALTTLITNFGLYVPIVLSGVVLVEAVFDWDGIGQLTANAVNRRDYPLVAGASVLTATGVVLGNLLADLLQLVADPRQRSRP